MTVLVDQDEFGNSHFIETDPAKFHKVYHPDNQSGLVGVDVMLLHHNEHPEAREVGGWHVVNQLPGELEPMTRWQRLVNACNHPDAHPQAKALGLK
jgi:hypothetical protein